MKDKKIYFVSILLRLSLSISFFYAAVSSFLNPTNWAGYIPIFLSTNLDAGIFLIIFSIYELILGLFLIFDCKTFYLSILSSITIFLIILFNINSLDIVFRDLPILIISITLTFLSIKSK